MTDPLVSASDSDLFRPYRLGDLTLANRVVMAPLTRRRAGPAGVPGPLNATYYRQRATAGLIIGEATNISPQGKGNGWTPGIFNDAQVAGWRTVTDTLHAAGGHIFCQLWHTGRTSHPALQPGGVLPVAPSAIRAEGSSFTEQGPRPYVTPRPLHTDEIAGIVDDYRGATRRARAAGFDGVEIHGANGYLIDQFIRSGSNFRTDRYGGSLENRLRLVLEIAAAVVDEWGGDHVGIRISPLNQANSMHDADPATSFSTLAERLGRLGLVYLHVLEGSTRAPRGQGPQLDWQALRRGFGGTYISNNGHTRATALAARAADSADLICFGRPFIANPDLVARLRDDRPLAEIDQTTIYGMDPAGGEAGYTDYAELPA